MTKFDTEMMLNHEGPHKSGDPIRGTLVVETDDWMDVDTITVAIDRIAFASAGPSVALPTHRLEGDPITIQTGRLAAGRHEIPWELEAPAVASRSGELFDIGYDIQAKIDIRHEVIELEPVEIEVFTDNLLRLENTATRLSDRREAAASAAKNLPFELGKAGFILGLLVSTVVGIVTSGYLDSQFGAVLATVCAIIPFAASTLGVVLGHLMRLTSTEDVRSSGIEDATLEVSPNADGVKIELRVVAAEDLRLKEISIEFEGSEFLRTTGTDPVTRSHKFARVEQTMLEDEDVESGWSQVFTLTKRWNESDLPSLTMGNHWVSWTATATIDELGALPIKLRVPIEVERNAARLLNTGGQVVATETVLDFDENESSKEEETVATATSSKLKPGS